MSTIGVLAAEESWYAADLRRAAGDRHEIVVLPFTRLAARLESHDEDVASLDRSLFSFAAVLVRTMPPGTLEQVIFRMDALARLADRGVRVINPPRSLEIAVDKYLTLARLRAAGLPTPRTWVGQEADDALQAFELLGGDVVVKPLFGGEGRGILRVSDADLALRTFTTLERLGAVLYLQEFVPHAGVDLRLFVLGRQVYGMKRINPHDWRTNVRRGARTEALEVTDELREIALRASAAIGTSVAGVDLLPARDGTLYAIELNAVPGWKALARTLDLDIAAQVLEHALEATSS